MHSTSEYGAPSAQPDLDHVPGTVLLEDGMAARGLKRNGSINSG